MRVQASLLAITTGILVFVLGPAGADVGSTFLGPDGAPLPFQSPDEILDFLRTAEVVDETPIGKGTNRSRKVLVEKDGVRAHAAFREADHTKRDTFLQGRAYRVFRDSYLFEPAAYELARLLGIENIPPAVLRSVGRRRGSLQLWVENVRNTEDEGFNPPSIARWVEQVRDMVVFDNLIFNADRNAGNMLTTQDYRLMMIDHTRAFQPKADLVDPQRLTHVNRRTWERLRALDEKDIADAVRPFLAPDEIAMLQIRHQMLLDHFEELIEARGEDVVII